jgi:transcriptional regulator with XRE-family HTH domain
LDITQKAIADYLHIKQNTYSQYENGQRQIPIEMLIALAQYYKTSTDYILELTDIKKPYPKK